MARASRDEKERSRERIVGSASRLLRERGIEGASVGELMKEAGLTHGGFYRHFATKDALVEDALDAAFREIVALLEAEIASHAPADARQRFRDFYLSTVHAENAGRGCPAAALAGEVARAPAATRDRFGAGVRTILSALARTEKGNDDERKVAAARDLAMMVGALALARASDADTADHILSACRSDSRPRERAGATSSSTETDTKAGLRPDD